MGDRIPNVSEMNSISTSKQLRLQGCRALEYLRRRLMPQSKRALRTGHISWDPVKVLLFEPELLLTPQRIEEEEEEQMPPIDLPVWP